MRVSYSCLRKRLSVLSKQLLMVAGLMALPITLRPEKVARSKPIPATPPQPLNPVAPEPDPRTVRLQKFLSKLHCPVAVLSEDFVNAADDNQLDWRLLPSISVIESSGGKAYRNNNLFGWGDRAFPTLRAGINEVAFKLGRSSLYRNLDNLEKLRHYNPDTTYPDRVMAVMNRISPVVNLRPVQRIFHNQNGYVYAAE
ncbi:MAG: glucosaminidase domain-containing protein [Acidobacteriaceae bacterium]|nr:glucosaminidase domain-containing protein [Acidobacteriaceae bacterium]